MKVKCVRGMIHQKLPKGKVALALINEAFLRLTQADTVDWQSRTHFFAISAGLMRRVLVEGRPINLRNRSTRRANQQCLTIQEIYKTRCIASTISTAESLRNLPTTLCRGRIPPQNRKAPTTIQPNPGIC